MLISLSKLDKKISGDFAKLYAAMVFTFADEVSPALNKDMHAWKPNAQKFIRKYKLDGKTFNTIFKEVDGNKNYAGEDGGDPELTKKFQVFAKSLRTNMASIEAEHDIDLDTLKIMKDCNTVANSESKAAFNRLIKNVSHLGSVELARHFAADVNDQSDILKELRKSVKGMTGSNGTEIDADTRKKFAKTEELKEYNRLRRELNAVPKSFIANFVRNNGGKPIPVTTALQELAKAGIKEHSVPTGFEGLIDDQMRYYTTAGKRLIQNPVGVVRMNPKYIAEQDNAYVCEYHPPFAAKPTRAYTEVYRKGKNVEKFEVTQTLNKNFTSIRRKWLQDMGNSAEPERMFIAHLVELIFQTSARVGGAQNNTGGTKTFGITTVLKKHMKTQGQSRVIAYQGKKGMKQRHVIFPESAVAKRLIAFIDHNAKDKKPADVLFAHKGKPISSVKINNYLRNDLQLGAKTTIHKFRTMKGSHMASQILASSPFKKGGDHTPKQVNDWVKKSFETVAEKLGHFSNEKLTVTTAIQNYIDPSILDTFFKQAGVRPIPMIQKAIDGAKL